MYIHLDFNSPLFTKEFPKEFGEIKRNFSDEKVIEVENHYLLNNSSLFDKNSAKSVLTNISKINFFVGANNSGKSRFLRGLFKTNKDYIYCSDSSKSLLDMFQELKDKVSEDGELRFFFEKNDLFGESLIKISELFTYPKQIEKNYLLIKEFKLKINRFENKDDSSSIEKLNFIEDVLLLLEKLSYNYANVFSLKVYMPVLRSLVTDDSLNKSSFNIIVQNKYGIIENVYTGLNLFDEISKLHNTVGIDELEKFATWIQENFYKNESLKFIPDSETKNIVLKFGIEYRPIFDIGDGIQQLILLLFPIFTAKNNTWFFVEEPETHLHPGLQRIFVETLLNDKYLETKNLRYFFTTHSNHFLDLSLQTDEISIFQFQKESQKRFNIKNVKPCKEILDLLGVNNSSVLMANSSIWVEGPTDRKYISKFLKLYCEQKSHQHLKEDIDFAFFEYGGNLIAHYLFDEDFDTYYNENDVKTSINAFALANKIYLLADNDNASGEKLLRGERLKKLSDNKEYFKYKNTDVVEIENLLPKEIIKPFLKILIKKDSDKEKVDEIDFSQKDYKETRLGEFLFDLLINKGFKEDDFFKFRAKSGTLVNDYKLKLCDFIINGNYTYDDLIFENEQLEEIIKDLYNFIKPKHYNS